MALKKQVIRQRSADSGVEPDRSLQSKEQRDQRISLFLQDFDHQARENLQEMKKELDALLQTAEKAFRVELLMMPALIRKMRRRDLIHLKDAEVAAAAIAETKVCMEDVPNTEDLPNPKVVRTNSKRVKVTTIVEYKDENEVNRMQATKSSRKVFKTHSLASLASGVKAKQSGTSSRSVYSTPSIRSTKKSSVGGQPVSTSKCTPSWCKKLPQRGLSQSASASERTHSVTPRSTSMPSEKIPFVNIPLADGQTLCSAGDDLQKINVDLLNDDTVQHIHTLVNQLTVLCGKVTVKSS